MERRDTPTRPLTAHDILDLVEAIWLPLDPNQQAEWFLCLEKKDLRSAQDVVIILKNAGDQRPTVRLFDAAYRGYVSTRGQPVDQAGRVYPGDHWFEEQREKLRRARREGFPPDLW